MDFQFSLELNSSKNMVSCSCKMNHVKPPTEIPILAYPSQHDILCLSLYWFPPSCLFITIVVSSFMLPLTSHAYTFYIFQFTTDMLITSLDRNSTNLMIYEDRLPNKWLLPKQLAILCSQIMNQVE